MKYLFLIASVMVLSISLKAQIINDQSVKSKISSSVVYLDGAEITRLATVNLREGKNIIRFPGISPQLVNKSMRVKCPNDVSILSLTSQIDHLYKKELTPMVTLLKDSLKIQNDKLNRLNDQQDALSVEKELLLTNRNLKSEQNGVSIQDLKEAATYYRQRIEAINIEMTKNRMEIIEISAYQQKIENQLYELKAEGNYSRNIISILLYSPKTQSVDVELKYVVQEAGWVPIYDIIAEQLNDSIKLIYRAKVYNNTQIDWKNVAIKLSTADPLKSADKPSMDPWYLNYKYSSYKKLEYDYFNDNSIVQEKGEASKSSALQQAVQAVDIPQGRMIEVSELSAYFEIKEKYTINADAKPYYIDVEDFFLTASYKHITIPKNDKYAFLLARITGWEEQNLISGYANVYFNDTYIGRSFINTAELTDTLEVSLGRDSKIIVNRTQLKEFTKKQLIGSNRKEVFAYEISVKNNRKYPVNLKVLDQFPVSQDNDIVVDLIDVSSASKNDLTGELEWNFLLKPNEVRKVVMSYSIKYPKTKPVRTQKYKMQSARFL
ncbi:MAG: hypothetical protein C0594_17510 [Marinilabiliales bacterium]|nr:MAG: hypothetical protein C0594_17510 [Marinilabiliales bacterium]